MTRMGFSLGKPNSHRSKFSLCQDRP